jgi:type III secretion system TyeA family effector delivery regulator
MSGTLGTTRGVKIGGLMTAGQLQRSRMRAGKLRGQTVSRVSVNARNAAHSAHAATETNKALERRTLEREAPLRPMGAEQIGRALHTSGRQAAVMELVAQIMRNGKLPGGGKSRQDAVQKHQALHIAAGLLDDESGESDWLLISAAMGGRMPAGRKALSRRLEEGDGDESSFASLFEPVLAAHGNPEALRKMLFAARSNPRLLSAVLRQAMGLNTMPGFRRRQVDAGQMARDLAECGDNIELIAALAEAVEGLQGNPVQTAQTLKSLRGDARKLAEFLRRAQGAPGAPNPERDALRGSLHGAIRELDLLDGDAIRGSYNALNAAADDPDPEAFLDAYHDVTAESAEFTAVLRTMLKHYPIQELEKQLNRTKKALGDDLRADHSSREKAHLSAILKGISNMHLSSSLLMMVQQFGENLAGAARAAGVTPSKVDGGVLMRELIDVIDTRHAQPRHFEQLLTSLGITNLQESIVALQGIKAILREMPDRIYVDDRVLPSLLQAAQVALDDAILREEAASAA